VLMSGANPMLSTAPKATDLDGMAVSDADPMSGGMGAAGGPAKLPAKQDGGKGFPRAQVPGFGRPVDLKGLPQVVGLALGAPEFQRR
jgi:hypothetical protein